MFIPPSLPPVASISIPATVAAVPFYSQFRDITSASWQKVGCGIASLAMVIDYYKPEAVTVNALLARGIAAGAYDQNAGWKHGGLVQLTRKYGLTGTIYDLSGSSTSVALARLTSYLKEGPVIVSVHYKFDPKSSIPHLVVLDGIDKGVVYYNDPAATSGRKQIATADFTRGWKKKFIVIRPVASTAAVAVLVPATIAAPHPPALLAMLLRILTV